jgi:hypothetical protein
MISKQSRSKEWIMGIREKSNKTDPQLIEKMILALTLVEGLQTSGLNFIFKGGTSLLLLRGSRPSRFSIDVDIILPTPTPLTAIEASLTSVVRQGVFHRFEANIRESNVPKLHYKFYFNSVIEPKESYILLDILFEMDPYPQVEPVAVNSELVEVEGEISQVKCPTLECLLGDKLTAFAPHTTGILYGQKKEMEIIKQLFDIGQLFDLAADMRLVTKTFRAIAVKELGYRAQNELSLNDVLRDIFRTACLIGMRGYSPNESGQLGFQELQNGIKQLSSGGYVYVNRFTIDTAILCAAKAAYLVALIQTQNNVISRFSTSVDLLECRIQNSDYRRLNIVKKTSPEAFYYFFKAFQETNLANK